MERIILHGNPRSTNNIYRHMCMGRVPRVYITNEGKTLKELYQWEAKSQWKKPPMKGDLSVTVWLYFQDKRSRDWDNFHKLSMDALTGIVWEDDSQIMEAKVIKGIHKDDPRIEIVINTLG